MPSAEYLRRQADICLRLSLAASDTDSANRRHMMAEEYKLRAAEAEAEPASLPAQAERIRRPIAQRGPPSSSSSNNNNSSSPAAARHQDLPTASQKSRSKSTTKNSCGASAPKRRRECLLALDGFYAPASCSAASTSTPEALLRGPSQGTLASTAGCQLTGHGHTV